MKHTECDRLVSLVNNGDHDAIVEALKSNIPFAAFRAILQAGDLKLSDDSVTEGVRLWTESDVEILGHPMKEYAKAVLYTFGKIHASDVNEAERNIASTF